MAKSQTLKGFRDFLPGDMVVRNKVISTLKKVFAAYGFSELATPTLEYAETLLDKYGEEAEKLMYIFKDNGGRQVGLKYDLTVPLARVMAQYPNLPKPFKRFAIQPAFRAENTQRGRYREFYQCDVDTVGTYSPLADAEILAIISDSLTALGFAQFKIRINSRKILFAITESPAVLQSLDKLDKKSEQEVRQELIQKGVSPSEIEIIFNKLRSSRPDADLQEIIDLAKQLGAKNIEFDPVLVRGLDYYTGAIFETVISEPKIGSITGGGRYNNLIKTLGGPDLPAVGTTIGLDRIVDVITELKLWNDLPATDTEYLITNFSPETAAQSLKYATKLRAQGKNVEIYPDAGKLDKQLKYASLKSIPFVVIIGPEEIAAKSVKIKNMATGEQESVPV